MTNSSRETIEINGVDMPVDDFMNSDHLVVNHNLEIDEKYEIYQLPTNLQVNGLLEINTNHINYLPENLVVDGSLAIIGTNITRLPETMAIAKHLMLARTKINYIPAQKSRVGITCMENTVPVKLADNMMCDSVYLVDTKVNELPLGLFASRLSIIPTGSIGHALVNNTLCLPNDLNVLCLHICSSLEAQPIPRNVKTIKFVDYHNDGLVVIITYDLVFKSSDTLVINGTSVSYDDLKEMTSDDAGALLLGETGRHDPLDWLNNYKYNAKTFWEKWRDEIIRHGETIAENA